MHHEVLLPIAGCLLAAALWGVCASVFDMVLLPPPSAVAMAMVEQAFHGGLGEDAWASSGRVLAGVCFAFSLTSVLVLAAALWPPFERIVSGPIELTRPVPPIAWTPLAIMALGVGPGAAVAIVTVGAFFPLWLSVARGLREVRKVHILAARSLGAGHARLLADVILPSILPYALHGLRLSTGFGWFSVVAAEMMGAPSGLGRGIQMSSLNLDVTNLYAYILTTGIAGFACDRALFAVERSVSHWRGGKA
ncbi:ABC transporter permease [Azospirillum sp. B506]|uniref:ABC transporter permease n=1 Tax=Azospirillum sp. B506 TaxID=137721 RepID=UPI00034A15B8|nr:ABC transporter permease [Azospirillum sp. B506]